MLSYFSTISFLLVSTSCFAAQDAVCADKIRNCRSYGQNVCVDYTEWAKINCARTCTFCSGPTPQTECKDYVSNCASYTSELCTGASYRVWAEDNCPKFCGFCVVPSPTTTQAITATTKPATSPTPAPTTTLPSTNGPCQDTINFCLVYSKSACNDVTWADTYCRKWCARC